MFQVKLRNDGAVVEVGGSSLKVSSFRERDWREKGMEELEFKEKRDSVVGADFQVEFSFLEAKGRQRWLGKLREVAGRGSWSPRWPHVETRSATRPGCSSQLSAFNYSARRFTGKSLRRDRGDSTIGWTVL